MNEQISLKEAYGKIKEKVRKGKWLEAHRACLEILRFDPENIKVIHLKNRIEKKVRKINRAALKIDLQKLKPLWKGEKYEELLTHLKQLEPYITDYHPLAKIILKAKNAYEKQNLKQRESYYHDEYQHIKDIIRKRQFKEAILAAEKLRILKIHDTEIRALILELKKKWVDAEIEDNRVLLKSEKYEDILFLYQRLFRIYTDSEKLKVMMEQTKKDYRRFRIEEKKEFIYKSLEELRTLFQLKKYERTVEGCREILDIDPENKTAREFLKKSVRKLNRQVEKEVILQIQASQKQLREQYIADRENYIRI